MSGDPEHATRHVAIGAHLPLVGIGGGEDLDLSTSIYHTLISRGVSATRPFVGNGLWVTSVRDPDGYRLDFESPTDVPEETVYSGCDAKIWPRVDDFGV